MKMKLPDQFSNIPPLCFQTNLVRRLSTDTDTLDQFIAETCYQSWKHNSVLLVFFVSVFSAHRDAFPCLSVSLYLHLRSTSPWNHDS